MTDDGDTFLVGQYRYTLDFYSWEIPEGGGAKTETPLAEAHAVSHTVKDLLIERYPQIADAIIHLEPPPQAK